MFPYLFHPLDQTSLENRLLKKLHKCPAVKRLISTVQKKPYSAVTVQIERLTSEQYEEDDTSGLVDLVEVVRLQSSGPSEAARAIRKKLKYGNVHRQLRALTVLDGLIQNAGPRFQRVFADEPLLERLRVAGTDPVSDPAVKAKCKILFGQWSVSYKDSPGMERIVALYRQLPQRKKPKPQQQSKVLKDTEAEADTDAEHERSGYEVLVSGGAAAPKPLNSPTSATSSLSLRPPAASHGSSFSTSSKYRSSKTKKLKSKSKPFNLEKEKPQLLEALASSSVASTNLMNALKLVNRESKRVSEDPDVVNRFEACKVLRRQILRYIQNVESEQWLGSLIHANEGLVEALMAFEVLDKSVEDDSDSDEDEWNSDTNSKPPKGKEPVEGFAGLTLEEKESAKQRKTGMRMPVPSHNHLDSEEEEEEGDEDDPFADRNAVGTPPIERPGMTW
ncbi:MAG: putative actin patch assembly and actin polymerization protein [Candelina submexicana]|nr:MAG: putative actin patch assembly and actin polymerization protein [Candelina submexicana]